MRSGMPAKTSIAVLFSSSSLGEKQLAKSAYVTLTTWLGRSVVIEVAHNFERTGLAMVGGAGGLYVAVGLMRMETELVSKWMDGPADGALRGLWFLCGHRSA